jgi:putative membrane protein
MTVAACGQNDRVITLSRPRGLRLFFTVRGSILRRVAVPLALCVAVAVLVVATHGVLFDWKVTLTAVPFSIIGLALAICLGFRNNVAYDRYWEGRRLWGELVNRSRSLARQLQSLTRFEDPARFDDAADLRTAILRRAIAHANALRHELRDSDAAGDVAPWLSEDDRAGFAASRLGSDWLMRRNGHDLGVLLRAGRIDPRLAAEVDATFGAMTAVAAGCERIRRTPVPFAYTLLLHRTASLYCFLLPFGLVDTIGLMTPFVVAIVAYTFFGLDAVGDEIEEPFGLATHHLPLSALCRTIEINLREAMGDPALPPPLAPVDHQLD